MYTNPKFTSGDLRETMQDDVLAELFQAILDAERIAQNHRCFYSPCGSIQIGIPKNATNPPDNSASSRKPFLFILIVAIKTLLV